jgi:type II secretory pathway pseudopilin PulG
LQKAIQIGGRITDRHRRQGGFTLVESILVVVVAVAIVVAIWYFGWMVEKPAGETALADHLNAIQKQVVLYMFDSDGQYPTVDGKLPKSGESEPIYWDAGFTKGSQTYHFYPDYVERKPNHWDEGIWLIDSVGKVSVNIDPKDY